MDPLTALGLAGNLITIIQAGLQLANEVKEVYTSSNGATQRNTLLEDQIKQLDSACNSLRTCIGQDSTTQGLSSTEVELRELAWKCAEAGARLNDLLNRVKAGAGVRKRDALLKAFKSRWKQDEIDQLTKEVEGYRNLLQTRILIDLRREMFRRQQMSERAAFDTPDGLIDTLKDSLAFSEMNHRQEQIENAHRDTLQWVYDTCPDDKDQWDCLRCWLKNEGGLYWMNGKAGSGKSTLTKYICSNKETVELLKSWAGDDNTIITSFFFWNSGTVLERSTQGLLRSILWQILEKSPKTAGMLFPRLHPTELATLRSEDSRAKYWTETKLITAIDRFISIRNADQHFCLFIDGLDEFGGELYSLIDLIQRLSAASHIKICVSSRPVQEIQDAFATAKCLRLEKLTAKDIHDYIESTLKESVQGAKLVQEDQKAFEGLVKDIAGKSTGVFLWVRLVAARLVRAINNGDNVKSLQERVNELPENLNDLFSRMIGNLEDIHKEEAASVLRIFFASPDPDSGSKSSPALSILDLFFSQEIGITGSLAYAIGEEDWQALENRLTAFERRIELICCGFIEFIDGQKAEVSTIQLEGLNPTASRYLRTIPRLLHRSVKEFLQNQATLPDFVCQPSSSDYEQLLAARIVTIKTILNPNLSQDTLNSIADLGFTIAKHMEEQTLITNTMLIDEINRSCMVGARRAEKKSWFHRENSTVSQITDAIDFFGLDEARENLVRETIDIDNELDHVAYAASFGLLLFVKAKVLKAPSLCKRTDKLPLLHAMQCVDWIKANATFSNPAYQDLLGVVLSSGADPNLKYKSRSAWTLRLNAQGEACLSPAELMLVPRDLLKFIEAGADPNATFDHEAMFGTSDVHYKDDNNDEHGDNLYSVLQDVIRAYHALPDDERQGSLGMRNLFKLVMMMLLDNAPIGNFLDDEENPEDTVSASEVKTIEHANDASNTENTPHAVHNKQLDSAATVDNAENAVDTVADTKDPNVNIEASTGIGKLGPSKNEPFIAKPVWRLSVLFWCSYGLITTADSQELCQRLIEAGATDQRPSIVKICVMGSSSEAMSIGQFKSCTPEESKHLTTAWWKHFPNYTVTFMSAMLNGLLRMLQDGGIVRSNPPLRVDELVRAFAMASGILSNIIVASQPKIPNANELFRLLEKLHAIDIITDEGLLRVVRLWNMAKIFMQEDGGGPDRWIQIRLAHRQRSLRANKPYLGELARNDDGSINIEKMSRIMARLQIEGYVDDKYELTEDSGLLGGDGDSKSILNGKIFDLDKLIWDNGVRADLGGIIKSAFGGGGETDQKQCSVM